ncbi:MAG: hypothetical protein AAGE01_17590 [Pseudomonadota bacterium]
MKHRLLLWLLFLGAAPALAEELPWPSGWARYGDPGFEIGVVALEAGEERALMIAGRTPAADRFGAIGQTIDAERFRGGKVRLTGLIRTETVDGGAGLWMRIDASDDGEATVLRFDNMAARPVQGDTRWARYEVILDVPPAATAITFGALLRGAGSAWFDELLVDEAPMDARITAMPLPRHGGS